MKFFTPVIFFTLTLTTNITSAIELEQQHESEQKVEIAALSKPEWRPYSAMYKGILAYEKYHVLAPSAPLLFQLSPTTPDAATQALQLRLANDEKSIDIKIDGALRFELPQMKELLDSKAELILNRKEGSFVWHPYIRSKQRSEGALRLGDFRLECRVYSAIEKEGMPLAARAMFLLLGELCESPRAVLFYRSKTQLSGVRLIDGERNQLLPAKFLSKDGRHFRLPLEDESWSNDTVIVLEQ